MKISISDGVEFFKPFEFSTVAELADVACKSNISTSVFKGEKRNLSQFEIAYCIGIDVDNDKEKIPTLSINKAKEIFSPFKHVILTSRNHQKEKNGIVTDRFRVILFLDTPIVSVNNFYATWFWLKDQYPFIDDQCKDASRLWFQHGEVYSINENGILIPQIRYTEPENPQIEGRNVLPGERGELSKQTLQVLEFGITVGSRNNTTYKIARDFNQSLYEYEEAESRIISSLERNGIISNDFPRSEAELAVRSAYSKDAKHAPRLVDITQRAFSYITVDELLKTPTKDEDWLIKDLFIKGGLSLIVGVPKIGKSTFVRQLESCVVKGSDFLNRKTIKGSVLHFSFDEKESTVKSHYEKLNLVGETNLQLHFGASRKLKHMDDFEEDLMTKKPDLVIIDTMFDLIQSEDINNYSQIKNHLAKVRTIAARSGSHIMFIHHQNKPGLNTGSRGGNSILGSQAIAGAVDCYIVFEQKLDSPTLRTIFVKGRSTIGFENQELQFDINNQIYFLQSKTNQSGVPF